jgi:hypothetical protein
VQGVARDGGGGVGLKEVRGGGGPAEATTRAGRGGEAGAPSAACDDS